MNSVSPINSKIKLKGSFNLKVEFVINIYIFSPHRHQRLQLLRNASARVWEELYVSKRPALEEVFRTSFGTANATPTLDSVRGQISEPATKVWRAQMEGERKAERTTAYEFQVGGN